jgi:hypothetical protein
MGTILGTLFEVMPLFCPITITPAPPVMRLAIGGQVPASPGKPPAGLRRAILNHAEGFALGSIASATAVPSNPPRFATAQASMKPLASLRLAGATVGGV